MRLANKIAEAHDFFSYSLSDDLRDAVWKAKKNRDSSLGVTPDESKWAGVVKLVDRQLHELSKFKALSAEVQEDGFTHLLILGVGGAGAAPGVFSRSFGRRNGSPELLVLNSMDPAQISDVCSRIDPRRTLFCVSSHSGTAPEAEMLFQYFFAETRKAVGDGAGHHFVAITNPGSKLEAFALEHGFRRVYLAETGFEGHHSAFSDFGMVPHAAAGFDTEKFLKRAKMLAEASKGNRSDDNPAVALGLILGTAAAKSGRNKITIICSHSIRSLGAWLEELLAGCNGEERSGLIPINREPLVEFGSYGDDRIFTYLKCSSDNGHEVEERLTTLEAAGHPVIRIMLEDLTDIAQTMLQWEVAVGVAGEVSRMDAGNRVEGQISILEDIRLLDAEEPIRSGDGIKLFTDADNAAVIFRNGESLGGVIRNHLDRLHGGDYFGLFAYIPEFVEHDEVLQQIRRRIVRSKQVATVVSFGPRFLCQRRQADEKGLNRGVFLQITCDDPEDIPVPGEKFTFGEAKAGQAQFDFRFLTGRRNRVVRVHLGPDLGKGLNHLRDLLCAAVEH